MSIHRKTEHTATKLKGKVRETAGKATRNSRMEAEGKAEQTGADAKQAGEKLKDATED